MMKKPILPQLMSASAMSALMLGSVTGNVHAQTVEETAEEAVISQVSEDEAVLEPVIVHGEKFSRDVFNTFTSVETVTAEEMDIYARQTLDEALNNIANVRLFESNGETNISIRGMSADGPTACGRSPNIISVSVDGAEQRGIATKNGTRGIWDVEQFAVRNSRYRDAMPLLVRLLSKRKILPLHPKRFSVRKSTVMGCVRALFPYQVPLSRISSPFVYLVK